MSGEAANSRSLGAILSEMKVELFDFAQTRIELLKAELQEKAKVIKAAVPSAVAGLLLLCTAFLLLSVALATLVAAGFGDSPFRWFFGFFIVGVFWSIGGGLALYMVKRRLTDQEFLPRKTVEVLDGDKAWLKNEARNAL